MPSPAEFFVAWAASQSDLTALIGSRISPWDSARKDGAPRVTYFLVSGDRVNTLAGPTKLAVQRWQLDCWGSSQKNAAAVARLFTGASGDSRLDGYRGTLAGITVQNCRLTDERDNSEIDSPCVSLDFEISWNTV